MFVQKANHPAYGGGGDSSIESEEELEGDILQV